MTGRADLYWEMALTWAVVGLLTGYFVGFFGERVNQGRSVLGDLVAGVIGAFVAGFPPRYFIAGRVGLFASVVAAAVGAWAVASAWRAATGPGRRGA
jgi:uncharacterized membrane protein YeaQ/YmgE (transglycosylase-associated protein family)